MGCNNSKILPMPFEYRDITGHDVEEVPCGHCAGCIRRRQNDWFVRCRSEIISSRKYLSELNEQFRFKNKNDNPCRAFFITLTYDDSHVPTAEVYKSYSNKGNDISVPVIVHSLRYSHIDDLFHTFRKWHKRNSDYDFSYFGCGEYGSTTFRSHYHILTIGLSKNHVIKLATMWQDKFCPDSKLYRGGKCVRNGNFTSECQLGVMVSEVPLFSFDKPHIDEDINAVCRYVSKYASKGDNQYYYKQYYRNWTYKDIDEKGQVVERVYLEKPKLFSSRFFGLGVRAFHRYSDSYDHLRDCVSAKVDELRAEKLSGIDLSGESRDLNELKRLNAKLLEDINGFKYQIPIYVYDKLFPHDYYDDYDDYKQVWKKRVVPHHQDYALSQTVPLRFSLSYARQIAIDDIFVHRYFSWLLENPGQTAFEDPHEDPDYCRWFHLEDLASHAVSEAAMQSEFTDFYHRTSLF